MESFGYYVFVLVAVIVGIIVFKKVATCLVKAIVLLLLLAALAGVYYFCFT